MHFFWIKCKKTLKKVVYLKIYKYVYHLKNYEQLI